QTDLSSVAASAQRAVSRGAKIPSSKYQVPNKSEGPKPKRTETDQRADSPVCSPNRAKQEAPCKTRIHADTSAKQCGSNSLGGASRCGRFDEQTDLSSFQGAHSRGHVGRAIWGPARPSGQPLAAVGLASKPTYPMRSTPATLPRRYNGA